jgi:hypothetical protein
MAEQLTLNQRVAGSSPARLTTIQPSARRLRLLFAISVVRMAVTGALFRQLFFGDEPILDGSPIFLGAA